MNGPAGDLVTDSGFEARHKAHVLAYLSGKTDVEPALHATDPAWFADLSAQIPTLRVHSAGGMLPFQSEGTLHGLPYYFRFRHGHASLAVGGDVTWEPLYTASVAHGGPFDGILDRDEFCGLMTTLAPQLRRAPFRYYFAGVAVRVWEEEGDAGQPGHLRCAATTEPENYVGWGSTPAEAYEQATRFVPSAYLSEHGWNEHDQRRHHALRNLSPIPLNVDDRVFPNPEPDFSTTRP